MGPFDKHNEKLDYYKYVESQRANYVDLTRSSSDPNESVVQLAKNLFDKSTNNDNSDCVGLILDDGMQTADIFCMQIELILHGVSILTSNRNDIFDLMSSTDPIVNVIRSRLNSAGFDLVITESVIDKSNLYCEVTPRPAFCNSGWCVLDYLIIVNPDFDINVSLDQFKFCFKTTSGAVYSIGFRYISVTNSNPNVPKQITHTPTIIIRGIPTPYVAGDAFAWLAKVKQWKNNMMMQNMNSAQQQYLQNINRNLMPNETNLLGFSQAEMNGMSDIFSFYEKNIQQECQESFPQSYFSCDNIGKENIFTPPQEDSRYKINESKQKQLESNLLSERKKQDDFFKQNISNFRKQYS